MPRNAIPNGECTSAPDEQPGDRDREQDEIIERVRAGDQLRPVDTANSVLGSGDRGPTITDAPDNHALRQGEQQEVNAAGAYGQRAEQSGDGDRREQSQQHAGPRIGALDGDAVRHDIRRDPED